MPKPPVVILAAGRNSRFFPLNTVTHKGLLELIGKPILFRTLDNLFDRDFNDILLVLSPNDLNSPFATAIKETYPDKNVTLLEQPEPKGMADALLQAKPHITGQFAVLRPDLMRGAEMLDLMLEKGAAANSEMVLCAIETATPSLYGILSLEGDRAIGLVEKPAPGTEPSNLKIEAVYLLTPNYLEKLEQTPEAEYAYEDALNALMQEQSVPVITYPEEVPSLKYPWHLFNYQAEILREERSRTADGAEVAETAVIDDTDGPVIIEAGAKVGDYAKIAGPAYIGRDALVGDYSFIRHSSMEAGSVAGAYSELVRSIMLKGATFHQGYIADSIIGQDARIGAGIITANKRHDRANITMHVKDKKVDLGANRFGTIIGDGTNLGVGVRTMPGTFIGAESNVYPAVTVYKNVPHQHTITTTEETKDL